MLRTFTYQITPHDTGKTILQYLTAHGYSHTILTHLKKTPYGILLNDTWAYMSAQLTSGDKLVTKFFENASPAIAPVSLPLSICYEDEDILVVNKPAGMPIHPSRLHQSDTLANAVCGYYELQGTPCPFRCINRIDRDTTGLILLAKNMLSAALLSDSMRKRDIHREYLAIVQGILPENGTVNAPIARISPSNIKRQVDFLHGDPAITHYRRLACENGLSLAALRLETGRTHQIRVHMSYLGYPLLGDALYYSFSNREAVNYSQDRSSSKTPDAYAQIKRQALHSYRLYFKHPITGVPLNLTAPLPSDMAAIFSQALPSHMEWSPLGVPFE